MKRPDHGKTCLTPGCPLPHRARGLCLNCYAAVHKRIKKWKKTTWKELERLGLALPPMPIVGRRRYQRFDPARVLGAA